MEQMDNKSNTPTPPPGAYDDIVISEAELDDLVEQGMASKENKRKRTIGRVVLFGLAALLLSYGVSGLLSDGLTVLVVEQLACAVLSIVLGCLAKAYQRVRLESKTRKQLQEAAREIKEQRPSATA